MVRSAVLTARCVCLAETWLCPEDAVVAVARLRERSSRRAEGPHDSSHVGAAANGPIVAAYFPKQPARSVETSAKPLVYIERAHHCDFPPFWRQPHRTQPRKGSGRASSEMSVGRRPYTSQPSRVITSR